MFLYLDVFIIAAVYRSINFIIAFCDKNFRNSCFKHTKIVLFCIRAFVLQASLHAAAACFQPLVASSVLLYKQRTSLVGGQAPNPPGLSFGQAAHQKVLALPCCCEIASIKKRADSNLAIATCPYIIDSLILDFSLAAVAAPRQSSGTGRCPVLRSGNSSCPA